MFLLTWESCEMKVSRGAAGKGEGRGRWGENIEYKYILKIMPLFHNTVFLSMLSPAYSPLFFIVAQVFIYFMFLIILERTKEKEGHQQEVRW